MAAPRLALLWHLHQPDYRDPDTGRPRMPWVRLHALRGYRDLLLETAERAVPWTINVVPSLLDQLDAYAAGAADDHLDATRAPADAVDPRTAAWLPAGHPAMTEAHPSYRALRARSDAGERLSVAEIRDLQVWATLAWFGATAHRDHRLLGELVARGRGFSEDDKRALLAVHDAVLAEIPALLRRLGGVDGPCVSVSPYYHPILPLVVDARSAHRALPHLPDDVAFHYPEDALRQLLAARSRAAEALGRTPDGLWPSEGAVSPEVVALAASAGFRWIATDASILARSVTADAVGRSGGWDLGSGVVGWFRDTDLSDRIGFRYAATPPQAALDDLVGAITARAGGDDVVFLALDGENPWESYPDAGGPFRAALADALLGGARLRGVSLDAASAEAPVGRVVALHTGSWIGGDLAIWAGHAEDRAAWRVLADARRAAAAAPLDRREAALRHLLAAEGSDWFWWYGEEFDTPHAATFDAVFRAHVAAAWRALGHVPPDVLDHPIRGPRTPVRTEPEGLLHPDEVAPATGGWRGAGRIRARPGSMAEASGVRALRFGWVAREDGTPDALWVRLDAGPAWALDPPPDARWQVLGGEVARYDAGRVTLCARSADAVWPDRPVILAP